MKRTLLSAAAALGLAAAMMVPVNLRAQAGGATYPQAARGMRKRGGERHPEIRKAIRHLEMAKEALKEGAHDFSGHRAEALKLTDQAIAECRKAMEADEK